MSISEKQNARMVFAARVSVGRVDLSVLTDSQIDRFLSWSDSESLNFHSSNPDQEWFLIAREMVRREWSSRGPTVREANLDLMARLDEGPTCPCCDRMARRYKRKLNAGMVRTLIWLYNFQRSSGSRFVSVADVAPIFVRRSNEISRLILWGLVREATPSEYQDRKSSGLYSMTYNGNQFVEGDRHVQSHVWVYNNVVLGFAETRVTVTEALGDEFSYSELMSGGGS